MARVVKLKLALRRNADGSRSGRIKGVNVMATRDKQGTLWRASNKGAEIWGRTRGRSVKISQSDAWKPGKGYGGKLYGAVVGRGRTVHSDGSVSHHAQRRYRGLARAGAKVYYGGSRDRIKRPGGVSWSKGSDKPVFVVNPTSKPKGYRRVFHKAKLKLNIKASGVYKFMEHSMETEDLAKAARGLIPGGSHIRRRSHRSYQSIGKSAALSLDAIEKARYTLRMSRAMRRNIATRNGSRRTGMKGLRDAPSNAGATLARRQAMGGQSQRRHFTRVKQIATGKAPKTRHGYDRGLARWALNNKRKEIGAMYARTGRASPYKRTMFGGLKRIKKAVYNRPRLSPKQRRTIAMKPGRTKRVTLQRSFDISSKLSRDLRGPRLYVPRNEKPTTRGTLKPGRRGVVDRISVHSRINARTK